MISNYPYSTYNEKFSKKKPSKNLIHVPNMEDDLGLYRAIEISRARLTESRSIFKRLLNCPDKLTLAAENLRQNVLASGFELNENIFSGKFDDNLISVQKYFNKAFDLDTFNLILFDLDEKEKTKRTGQLKPVYEGNPGAKISIPLAKFVDRGALTVRSKNIYVGFFDFPKEFGFRNYCFRCKEDVNSDSHLCHRKNPNSV